jgi:hypothetical protein
MGSLSRVERAANRGWTNGPESIAACNFNIAGFVFPKGLALCRKLKLGAIMLPSDPAFTNLQYIFDWKKLPDLEIDRRVKHMVAASGSNPAIMGYFITDEPVRIPTHFGQRSDFSRTVIRFNSDAVPI